MAVNRRIRMSKAVSDTVRIGPRISKPLYMLAKYAYSLQNVSLEDRIQELLRKDLESITKQRWFTDLHASMNQKDVALFTNAFGTSVGPDESEVNQDATGNDDAEDNTGSDWNGV